MSTLQTCSNYAIFFDDVRVDDLVKNWVVNLSCKGNIGTASIEFVYMEDIARKAYDIKDIERTELILSMLGAVDSMTNVKIFSQNPFTRKFVMIFDGVIRGKSRTKTAQGPNSLTFTATDHMSWLNRTSAPIMIPITMSTHPSDKFVWEAMGIDTSKVLTMQQRDILNFKGRTLTEIINLIVTQALAANKIYSDKGGVGYWDGAWERMDLMADIDPDMINKDVLDYIVDPNQTCTDTMYVLLNDILSKLMFEFYQDRDGMIRIKPPFWSEPVLISHIIDPMLIVSQSESTNYDNFLTRVIIRGGLDSTYQTAASEAQNMWTPIGCYTSNGAWANGQSVQSFEIGYAPYGGVVSATATGSATSSSSGGTITGTYVPYDGNGKTQMKDMVKQYPKRIDRIKILAGMLIKEYPNARIIPSITLAQFVMESGCGISQVALEANNLFGVHATKNYKGQKWQAGPGRQMYRKYDSVEHAVHDRLYVVLRQKNFIDVVGVTDPWEAFKILERGGYYGNNSQYKYWVMDIVKDYDMINLYDKSALEKVGSSSIRELPAPVDEVVKVQNLDIEDEDYANAFSYDFTIEKYPKYRNDNSLIVGKGDSNSLLNIIGSGIWFPDVKTGIRAHIQHLAGLSRGNLYSDNLCVDPSFKSDNIVCATVYDFSNIKNRNSNYASKVIQEIDKMYKYCPDINIADNKKYWVELVSSKSENPLDLYDKKIKDYTKDRITKYFTSMLLGRETKLFRNMTVSQFVCLYIEEARLELINPCIALAQVIVDTGFLEWGGNQDYRQNNFAKLGTGDKEHFKTMAKDWY